MDELSSPAQGHDLLLRTLEQLITIDAVDRQTALTQMSQLLAEALGADKVDISLYQHNIESLVAFGTSTTAMGQRQHDLGMERLPLANDGREVEVYLTGAPHFTGHADQDAKELTGLTEGLGIRSSMVVPLDIAGERRGVLLASSATPDRFTPQQLALFEAAAHWVGVVIHRAELIEQARTSDREQGRRMAADELVTVVAHDLRNYLTPLKARIDLILRRAMRKKSSRDLEDAQVAAREIERLSRLVANLLDASRLEQGLFGLNLQAVDLVVLAQQTAEALSTPRNPVQLRAAESIDEIVVTADPDRVRQALENLLANAQRYSPPQTPVVLSLEVRTAAQHTRAIASAQAGGHSAPGPTHGAEPQDAGQTSYGVLAVIDRGPGIPPDILSRLFTRFASGVDSPGLGIGLYLASEIARAHAGSLTATTEPQGGTRFELALPIDGPVPGVE